MALGKNSRYQTNSVGDGEITSPCLMVLSRADQEDSDILSSDTMSAGDGVEVQQV